MKPYTKDLTEACFNKVERKYGISSSLRSVISIKNMRRSDKKALRRMYKNELKNLETLNDEI